MIFVNLPVKDLDAAKEFFTALGFAINAEYTNERGASVVIDDNIFAMLLVEDFFATFADGTVADAHTTREVIVCLSCESREQVDETIAKAIAAGGKPGRPAAADGPMYGGSFHDLDGHVWELMHLAK
jgi:predicted lactoylglutathione lyase